MADFGFLSDTDESAVEELISQAQDLCVLEQISAINCSSFTDSALPTDLESRFRRLKSFPVAKPGPKSSENTSNSKALLHSKSELGKSEYVGAGGNINFSPSKQGPYGNTALEKKSEKDKTESSSFSDEEGLISPDYKQNPVGEKGLKGKNKHGSVSTPSNSSDSCLEDVVFSPPKQNPKERDRSGSKRKPKSRSISSPMGSSSNSRPDSPSPPRTSGCFWCSPKKVSSKKKSRETKELGSDLDCEKYDEFLSDMSAFSVQEQRKILKKALKEQQKLSREAAKMVKLAKQASSRMSFHGIGDELSEDENGK
ncbi:hypothetical protein SLA2020_466760 [Shorea laevis]